MAEPDVRFEESMMPWGYPGQKTVLVYGRTIGEIAPEGGGWYILGGPIVDTPRQAVRWLLEYAGRGDEYESLTFPTG